MVLSPPYKYINVTQLLIAELDVGILYNQSNITTVYVNKGDGLPEPLICGVSPDPNRYNEALKLNWRRDDGTSIPSMTGQSNTITQTSDGHKKLYIKNVTVNEEGWYQCEYTVPWANQTNAKSLQVLVNGLYSHFDFYIVASTISINCFLPVDCGWSEWGNCYGDCGVGSRSRSAGNPSKRHHGRKCIEPLVENCTDLPLCKEQLFKLYTFG